MPVFLYISSSNWKLRPLPDVYLNPFPPDTHHDRKKKTTSNPEPIQKSNLQSLHRNVRTWRFLGSLKSTPIGEDLGENEYSHADPYWSSAPRSVLAQAQGG